MSVCVFFGWNGWLENSGRPKNRDGGPRMEFTDSTHFNTMTHHRKKMEKKLIFDAGKRRERSKSLAAETGNRKPLNRLLWRPWAVSGG